MNAHYKSTLLVVALVGLSGFPAVVSSMTWDKDREKHTERLRGSLLLEDVHHRKVTGGKHTSAPLIDGVCLGAHVYSRVPFSASAYDNCTSFHESSAENLGGCGDPNLALDADHTNDHVCHARAPAGSDCYVAYTQRDESLQYSFYVNKGDHVNNAVFNIILRLAAKSSRTVRVDIDSGGKHLTKDLVVAGTGANNFKDVMWEGVQFPNRGLQNVLVEFIDGQTNFCNIQVEETTADSDKTLVIPFNASAQKYISFYEPSSHERTGTCGSGPVDSLPTSDQVCNDRGSDCTIAGTKAGDQLIYLVNNPNQVSMRYNVTLRLASSKQNRHVMLQLEGEHSTYKVHTSGRGMQAFDDATASLITFPPGPSRLFVTFVDKQINMCSITIQ